MTQAKIRGGTQNSVRNIVSIVNTKYRIVALRHPPKAVRAMQTKLPKCFSLQALVLYPRTYVITPGNPPGVE